MVKKRQKKLDKINTDLSRKLYSVVDDIIKLNLGWYKITTVKWYNNLYKTRVWKIRVVFSKTEEKWIIDHIDFRWDVYKWL